MIKREEMILEERTFEEYKLLRNRLKCPTSKIRKDDGCAEIISPLEFGCENLFLEFKNTPYARRASIRFNGKWVRIDVCDIDDKSVNKFLNIAERTSNLIYLSFHNHISDNNISDEMGFQLSSGKALSAYTCIPGERRHEKCTWRGSDKLYAEIHGLVDNHFSSTFVDLNLPPLL